MSATPALLLESVAALGAAGVVAVGAAGVVAAAVVVVVEATRIDGSLRSANAHRQRRRRDNSAASLREQGVEIVELLVLYDRCRALWRKKKRSASGKGKKRTSNDNNQASCAAQVATFAACRPDNTALRLANEQTKGALAHEQVQVVGLAFAHGDGHGRGGGRRAQRLGLRTAL